jgi:carbon starvation protein CstA
VFHIFELALLFRILLMTVHFGYDKKQVLHALRYHFLTRPEIKLLIILVNVFAILSAVLAIFKVIQPFSFLVFSLLWLALMFIVWKILPLSIYKRSHTFQDQFSLTIDERHVELNNPRGNQVWPWHRFSAFVESPYFFHLYFDSRSFFLLPKDSFKDITDVQAVRKMFREKIRR